MAYLSLRFNACKAGVFKKAMKRVSDGIDDRFWRVEYPAFFALLAPAQVIIGFEKVLIEVDRDGFYLGIEHLGNGGLVDEGNGLFDIF